MPIFRLRAWWSALGLSLLLTACTQQRPAPPTAEAPTGSLPPITLCGPPSKQFGQVDFAVAGSPQVQADFTLGVALLHSFEYETAEKVFARILSQAPDCAMAYWGVAMSSFHPLWTPPTPTELAKGAQAVAQAQRLRPRSGREAAYVRAVAAFYQDYQRVDHHTRSRRFAQAMQAVRTAFPTDREATIFYALALTAAADPADKTFRNQRQAGALLQSLYPGRPNHPGIVHYLIHAYDYPELAQLALPAARSYAGIAPSSAHALHMPSHIFTRLGLWPECITSNLAAASSARCYAENAGLPGHWDEELHCVDYLAYAYLQQGDNRRAQAQVRYLDTMRQVSPITFKVAYALAAVPARYVLENRQWAAAARLRPHRLIPDWRPYPWQRAMLHFARALGFAHSQQPDSARREVRQLDALHQSLRGRQDAYQAQQVEVQLRTAEAWLLLTEGHSAAALSRMQQAAELEARTEKHPVAPSEVLPARELLADMLRQLGHPAEALAAYETSLQRNPNRFNSLYGAAQAAAQAGHPAKAQQYCTQLLQVAAGSSRPELAVARQLRAQPPAPAPISHHSSAGAPGYWGY